jgi:hypothetical protein
MEWYARAGMQGIPNHVIYDCITLIYNVASQMLSYSQYFQNNFPLLILIMYDVAMTFLLSCKVAS